MKFTFRPHDLHTGRLLAFSDGVFAIAITILILEIKIPNHDDLIHCGGLYNYLIHIWPAYLAYALSFLTIGVYWSNHHWLFSFVKRSDHYFNLLNILFLMTISFMPFSTAILSDYLMDSEYRNAAVSAFSLGCFLPVPAIFFVFLYAVNKHRLVDPNLSKSFIRSTTLKLCSGILFTVLAFVASFFYPMISLLFILILTIIYLLPPSQPEYDAENNDSRIEG